ncbi:MAG TPA: flagellar hook assembly protein FlgD [Thiotrichales bacterium]|nr:flagellar hook assembly protein FlgD [Thiotrichales bacterium]
MADLNLGGAISPVNAGVNNALSGNVSEAAAGGSSELGQADFIELLVAQMKNQDPSKPMDPSQFMDQLAQFSTVNGIQDLNTSFNSLAGNLTSDQALQAAGLVGRNVLIAGNTGTLENGGSVRGQITLPQSAANISLKVIDAQGVEVRELPLGSAGAGELPFQWDGFENDGSAALPGDYRLVAEAIIGGEPQALEVAVESRVNSITLGQDSAAAQLNLASGEIVPFNQILAIK